MDYTEYDNLIQEAIHEKKRILQALNKKISCYKRANSFLPLLKQNQLYRILFEKAYLIIRLRDSPEENLNYKVIAVDKQVNRKNGISFIKLSQIESIKEIPVEEIPLYIHYECKSETFINLLKGNILND